MVQKFDKLNFMQWQDIIISLAQIGFIFALIPSIRSKNKPSLATSVMYASLITLIAFCLLTLELWFSALTAALGATAWVVLAVQKIKLDKKK